MSWYLSFGKRRIYEKVVICSKKRLQKTKDYYLYEILSMYGLDIRYKNYLEEKEENEDNLCVHIKGNMRKCELLPCNKEYYQEPDDYEDGIGIILFPKTYFLLKIFRGKLENSYPKNVFPQPNK